MRKQLQQRVHNKQLHKLGRWNPTKNVQQQHRGGDLPTNTSDRRRFDNARFTVLTTYVDRIKESVWLKVDDDVFLINLVEETPTFECRDKVHQLGSRESSAIKLNPSSSGFSSIVPETMEREDAGKKRQMVSKMASKASIVEAYGIGPHHSPIYIARSTNPVHREERLFRHKDSFGRTKDISGGPPNFDRLGGEVEKVNGPKDGEPNNLSN
ncbi:hypothetical protein Ancab_008108, partial [Ancistrocladus abbreviatus]